MGYFSRLLSTNNRPVVLTAGGGSSSLLTDLAAYWKLDETSGTRIDSGPNGQDLTDNDTVPSATGKISNGADFEYDVATEYLSHADSDTLSLGSDTDFTLCCWVKLESKPAFSGGIICKNADSGNGAEYYLRWDTADRFYFTVGSGTTNGSVPASTLGAPVLDTWYFIVAWHDSTADRLRIQINNGTVDESGVYSDGTQVGAEEFRIGAYSFNPGFHFDGIIDEVGFWKRVLTVNERTELYNSGSGKTYPFS